MSRMISNPGRFLTERLLFWFSASLQGVDLRRKGAHDDKGRHALGGAARAAIGWFRIRLTAIRILHR